ncbi:host cell division inhibitor Icd-like protein [Cronobacter sakazakii]|uniref:host cell division inhibitor Icd-like protein n=1 Tax=Cronobacter sakazakii TaxID=28141 RepID=UPI000BE90E63|nr:host cell division inhibitor Icd-like protein [Cronobacter sakazakii]PQY13790.1 Ash-like/host cell division inhibitor Icd-like protein [Cronobacter sakazakii]PXY68715.1 host cell division inhibitor Icd-like protein [Cronobacter sakazakii]
MCEKRLFSGERSLYSFLAAAKSAAGRRNPSTLLATQHAPCVFFYVVASVRHFLAQRFLCRCAVRIMVAQAGQPSGWPVSNKAGIPTPVWATTLERRNSGGSSYSYLLEIVPMTTAPAAIHPEFTFIFAAVRRTDTFARPCMLRTVAGDERTARARLVRDYVLSFAGRLPVKAVAA